MFTLLRYKNLFGEQNAKAEEAEETPLQTLALRLLAS
jgi:hypothetical protein